MRTIFAVCTLGLWSFSGNNVLVSAESDDGTKRNRLRRLRYISSAHYRYSNQYYGSAKDVEEEEAASREESQQSTRGNNYQTSVKDLPQHLEGDNEEALQAETVESTAVTGTRANQWDRSPGKAFGSASFWDEGGDTMFGEDGFDARAIGFSMPSSSAATTQPKPLPTATSAPSAKPPVPSPTVAPTAPAPEHTPAPTVPAPSAPAPVPPLPTPAPMVSSKPSTDASNPPAEPPTREDREVLIQAKCGLTAIERSRDILVELLKVSRAPDLVNPITSQFAARDWIDNVDGAIICHDNVDRIHQRYRSALLYFEMGGSQWTRCRADDASLPVVYDDLEVAADEGCPGVPFLDKKNECGWYGMDCGETYDSEQADWLDRYFPLQGIDLQSNNLAGTLFDELYGLGELRVLQLSGNEKILGSLSEDIGLLGGLEELDISGNALSGSLPAAMYGLSELTSLRLAGNSLVGKISNDIGGLSKLTSVQLHSNLLNGTVPESGLFLLQQLATLSIQENQIEGSLNALCDVLNERRNEFQTYLTTLIADCDKISCSCCTCS